MPAWPREDIRRVLLSKKVNMATPLAAFMPVSVVLSVCLSALGPDSICPRLLRDVCCDPSVTRDMCVCVSEGPYLSP